MSGVVRLRAFAKINLSLHVLGRRPDDYHEVRTIFQAVSLYDTLELARVRRRGLSLETNDPNLPRGRENLVWRAIEAIGRELQVPGGVRARLTKRIPAARGLGGGSSDAAAALVGMRRLTGGKLTLARLIEIAAGLGADVPFFLFGGRALGAGRGDEIYPLPDGRKQTVVIVSPRDIAVNTREAYAWLSPRLTRGAPASRIACFCALCWGRPEGGVSNDFEGAVFERHPRLREIKSQLLQGGAAEAALAGSGSAVFGIFRNPAQARRAAQRFPDDRAFVVETLKREECSRPLHGRTASQGP